MPLYIVTLVILTYFLIHLACDLVFRLECCYDVIIVKSEGTHSKETGLKNGFQLFPLKPRNINTLLKKNQFSFSS